MYILRYGNQGGFIKCSAQGEYDISVIFYARDTLCCFSNERLFVLLFFIQETLCIVGNPPSLLPVYNQGEGVWFSEFSHKKGVVGEIRGSCSKKGSVTI